jgi:nitrite reductase/ring-hydroxylating ferredoxin subunit
MRRVDGLHPLSRREVCTGVAGCLGIAALASCVDGSSSAVQTGALGGGGGGGGMPDASLPHDGHLPNDSSVGATCPTAATDVGAPSTFVLNQPVYVSNGNFFVVRDAGGLYALTARCTHEGATCVDQSGVLFCPRHGAEFDYNGGIIAGPVSTGLVHYAMCTMSNGHVGVITTMTVPKTQRLVA